MDQDFTEREPRVGYRIPKKFLVSPIEVSLVVRLSSSDLGEGPQLYRLSIEAPTSKEGIGIFQAVSARFFDTVSRDPSTGGS